MNKSYLIQQLSDGWLDQLLATTSTIPTPAPLNNILSVMRKSAKCVVTETEYIDKDYQDELSAFYCKSFKNYLHRCYRLHFFSEDISTSLDPIDLSQYKECYLGFSILRPQDLRKVGRTVLSPLINSGDSVFVTCHARFRAHILGTMFEVDGMPFLQQDSQVGACAQAALWMVARYMSGRYGHREYLPSEINQLAYIGKTPGRPLPGDRGLTLAQILNALLSMGYSAEIYCADESLNLCAPHVDRAFPIVDAEAEVTTARQWRMKLADIVYRYIESGLPVLLCTANHAVVAIGHTYDPNASGEVHIQRIPSFIAHNDNTGPYIDVPIQKEAAVCFAKIEAAIVLAPREVTLRGEEAEDIVSDHIYGLLEKESFRKSIIAQNSCYEEWIKHLEFRTYLRPSVEFQQDLRACIGNPSSDYSSDVARRLLNLDYPKFIWVSEISSSSLLNHKSRHERKCLGRIVVDSTAPSGTKCIIAVHFADLLFLHNRQLSHTEPSIIPFPKTTPFKHKLWT